MILDKVTNILKRKKYFQATYNIKERDCTQANFELLFLYIIFNFIYLECPYFYVPLVLIAICNIQIIIA